MIAYDLFVPIHAEITEHTLDNGEAKARSNVIADIHRKISPVEAAAVVLQRAVSFFGRAVGVCGLLCGCEQVELLIRDIAGDRGDPHMQAVSLCDDNVSYHIV